MSEASIIRWLLVALLAVIGVLWAAMDERVSILETFRAEGGRCTYEDCRAADVRLTRLESRFLGIERDVANLPPQWLQDEISDIDERLRRVEIEHQRYKEGRLNP